MDVTGQNTSNQNINRKIWILDIILISVGIVLDQITKHLAKELENRPPIALIHNVLELHYTGNSGASFGILQGGRIYFIIVAVIVFIVIGWILKKIPSDKKFNKLHIALSLVLAGAVGNTIDRVIRGYVIDFIYFKIINFPIFNVADIFITTATFWLAAMILFIFKDEDFDFLRKNSGSGE